MLQKIQTFFSSLTTIISSKRTLFCGATANHNDSVYNYVQYSGTLLLKTGYVKYQDTPSQNKQMCT
jgi:D-alanyl-D-alanine carboxypeptidase